MKFSRWIEIKAEEQFLQEAKFGNANMEKVANIIASYVGKKIGGGLYPYGGISNYSETYTKSNGHYGVGFRFISDDGKGLRIDFDADNRGELSGVTYWGDFNTDPTYYIEIPPELNSIESADLIITSILQTGSAAQFQNLTEARASGTKLNLADLDPSLLTASGNLKRGAYDLWKKHGVDLHGKTWDDLKLIASNVKIVPAGKEKTSRAAEARAAEELLAKKPYADVDTIFSDLSDLVKMVLTTKQPSLLITGMAGIGKTYTVTEIIKQYMGPEGGKWVKVSGKLTPVGLFQTLFINRNKLIVFDDCDSVFANSDTENILKAALDSYDVRTITWLSKSTQDVSLMNASELKNYYAEVEQAIREANPKVKMPSRFDFVGKVIFISNIPAAKMDQAVKSRSFVIDIMLSRQDVLKRIESILPDLDPGTSLKLKKEAFEVVKAASVADGNTLNMRSMLKAIRIRQAGMPRWKELIKNGYATA